MLKDKFLEEIAALTIKIEGTAERNGEYVELLVERGKLYLKLEQRNDALNDFNEALSIDDNHVEARSYKIMISQIDGYFYNQTYNV